MATQDDNTPVVFDEKATLLTKDGLRKLEEELESLKKVKRREVAARIKEAISYGDLSENSEYEEAKNEQAFVEGRILELEEKVKSAQVIKSNKGVIVQLGAKVKIKDMENNEVSEYTIVGSTEADPLEGRISNESPVGAALLERKVGDELEIVAPKGMVKYKIMSLSY
ncbi:transcription elongation factor GreA [Candidatus Peregrinibacteria bacterium CG11_big_fil_rev_8_21_14_0_20_41_10]|nr:MAG: transcription elongation factor GreA [Candidatus Peregrinibacteria bacterium CG11_big_fil_rev_8_21_14_0_20_41_10]PIZ74553.1 MAG: transcription elongation factor GreA [Candidatus Peregrinibacteria bacterium CG_4_10_14_0_2_um_filter_41_8]PJC38147.1 MAG: transcription elongation factor GreA [Candidatus Peregrinibacteria bacterium CG_4_9_14_0_2_um_filter_41_14]